MSKSVSVRIIMDVPNVVSRFNPKFQLAQKRLDSEVLRTSAPFVPMRTGALMRSGTNGTKLGTGEIVYDTPYAKKMYYGLNYNFSKDKHPQACAQWFEKAKAIHFDDWMKTVSQTIKGDEKG